MIPGEPGHELVRLEADVGGDWVDAGHLGGDDVDQGVHPDCCGHRVGEKCEERDQDQVGHGVDSLACLVEQGDHQGNPLPKDQQHNEDNGGEDGGSDGSHQPGCDLLLTLGG